MKTKSLHKTFESFKDSLKVLENAPDQGELDRKKKEAWEIVSAVVGFITSRTSYSSQSLRDNMPFFSTLIAKLKTVMTYDPQINTMATDGKNIFINPNFVFTGAKGKPLTQRHIFFIFCHEIMHNALVHFARRGTRNPKLWNYATDYEINPILVQQGILTKEQVKNEISGLYEDKYVGKSAEEIYSLLEEEIKKRKEDRDKNKQPPKPAEPAKVGDYIKIKGQNKYAKVTAINGNDYEVEEVTIEEVRTAKKNGQLKKSQ